MKVNDMHLPNEDDIARLERAILDEPTSVEARAGLLEAMSVSGRLNDPRRFELIKWFLQHDPKHEICFTPYMQVDPAAAPEVYQSLKADWLVLASNVSSDAQLTRAAAAFVAAESRSEATRILRMGIDRFPQDAKLWLDLGRTVEDPAEQLDAYDRARDLGENSPNLLVWIAASAVKAGAEERAQRAAAELMRLVGDARSEFGDRLDWPERGTALWRRAKEACRTDEDARELTRAIAHYAYRKHWGHTVLGLLASRRGDVDGAVAHLRASAEVHPDHRLFAYGPSLELVRELCSRGRWDDGLAYLRDWERIWGDSRVHEWIAAVNERRLPERSDA